jgi:NadR type nicotinamide-nucleotide adenylyltransferase
LLKRICITGPESTGKSWLAEKLAAHYKTVFVPEYAVEYLTKHGADYKPEDILAIAKGQVKSESRFDKKANKFMFCDTGLIVCKIWSQVVFGEVDAWIEEMIGKHHYDLFLLMAPDMPWESALFRENPDDRDFLFNLYEQELISKNLPYRIINGHGYKRLEKAVNFVDALL